MAELKPCPFCGGEAELREEGDGFFVSCENDRCNVIVETMVRVGRCEHDAIEAWNRRAGDGNG
jgi:hypothetical protein